MKLRQTDHPDMTGKLMCGSWAGLLFVLALPLAQAQDLILDNSDPRFTTLGTWPASTAVTGYQGNNYQVHEANGAAPGALLIDNTHAGFSVTGTWPVSTSVAGYLGSNYQVHSANGEEPSAIILDNPQGQATGTWPTSTAVTGYYGSHYQTHAAGGGNDSFNWNTTITGGTYNVYARWTAHPNRATNAQYTITDSAGSHTVTVNQQTNGGSWQLLGSYAFDATASITLSDQANGYVIADAIKIVPPGAAPNTATWTPGITTPGSYNIYARWSAYSNRATNATYTVTDTTGSHPVSVNQQQNGGTWNLLGTFNLDASSQVNLTDQANGYVIADALEFVPANQPQANTATWTPSVSPGSYQVYAKWTQLSNRATNATYTVTDSSGDHPVSVDQQQNGGIWNLLGTFSLDAASTIQLTDQANGYVIADAIMLTPVNLEPAVYYIHTDHLDTPREITDAGGNVVWQWDNSDPFGNNVPNENPAGQGAFNFNLRFPGQYYDGETNTHYNYYRDHYFPDQGRYGQSDPIGLVGGSFSTYTYAANDPLTQIDPLGLASLYTDIKGRTTTFDPRPEVADGIPFTIPTSTSVAPGPRTLPGANEGFQTPNIVGVRFKNPSVLYGPKGAYIDVGDTIRQRNIHGGGSCANIEDAQAPQQGWCWTRGCTRGQNEDVIEMGRMIQEFQIQHPGVPIPYFRY